MRSHLGLRFALAIATWSIAAPLWAGVPLLVGLTSIDDAYSFVSNGGSPVTSTITLNFNANGTSGVDAAAGPFVIQGGNSGDFNIIGGTCGTAANLSSGNPSCTLIVRYTPSSSSPESTQLSVSCATVAVSGGFSLLCGSPATSGNISLLGSFLVSSVAAPTLNPRLLTLLSLLVLGAGVYFAARRN